MPPVKYALSPEQFADPNMGWDFPQEFLDVFHKTRGLCPANPEGDYAFMDYLYRICLEYQATAPAQVPVVIDSITPDTAVAGGPDITLTIAGSGFKDGATVYFGQAFSPLVLVSETEGSAEFAAAGYASPGNIPVKIVTPYALDSNSVDFVATASEFRDGDQGYRD